MTGDVGTHSWATWSEWVGLMLRGVTARTASRVAVVVGTLLSAINQGQVIVDGKATALTWVRVGFNYVIPFTVASIGYLAPLRRRSAPTS